MRITIELDRTNHLCYRIQNGASYLSKAELNNKSYFDVIMDGEADMKKASLTDVKRLQGGRLSQFVPEGLHKQLCKKQEEIRERGLTITLTQQFLANLPWEYIPVRGVYHGFGDEPPMIWQELPLMRTIEGSSYCPKAGSETLRVRYFQSKFMAEYPLGDLKKNVLRKSIDVDTCQMNAAHLERSDLKDIVKETFLEMHGKSEFLLIASHARCEHFITETGSPYCEAGDIRKTPVIPRFVLADGCHTAEAVQHDTGDKTTDWNGTLLAAYIRKNGAAIYIGSVGTARYESADREKQLHGPSEVATFFSKRMKKYLFMEDSVRDSWVKALRGIRIEQRQDEHNSQVVYVASDFDPALPFETILTDAGLPTDPNSLVRRFSVSWFQGIGKQYGEKMAFGALVIATVLYVAVILVSEFREGEPAEPVLASVQLSTPDPTAEPDKIPGRETASQPEVISEAEHTQEQVSAPIPFLEAAVLPPYSFILQYDDGSDQDHYQEIAYMGSADDGNDGSITSNANDTSEAYTGASSMRFRYRPSGGSHWAGVMILFASGQYKENPGDQGPDLSQVCKMTFYVKGSGGAVKFFVECDGGPQSAVTMRPSSEWQQVVLELDPGWSYCNIPFGWVCNQADPDQAGGTIEFWVDGIRFE